MKAIGKCFFIVPQIREQNTEPEWLCRNFQPILNLQRKVLAALPEICVLGARLSKHRALANED